MATSIQSRRRARARALRAAREQAGRPAAMRPGRELLAGTAAAVGGAGLTAAAIAAFRSDLFSGAGGDDGPRLGSSTPPHTGVEFEPTQGSNSTARAVDVFETVPASDVGVSAGVAASPAAPAAGDRSAPAAAPTAPSAAPTTSPDVPSPNDVAAQATQQVEELAPDAPVETPAPGPGTGSGELPGTPPDQTEDHDEPGPTPGQQQPGPQQPPPPHVPGDDGYVDEAPPPPPPPAPIDRMTMDELMEYWDPDYGWGDIDWERLPHEVIDYYNPGGDELSSAHMNAVYYDTGVYGPEYWYYGVLGEQPLPPERYDITQFHAIVSDEALYREMADLNGDGVLTASEEAYFVSNRMPLEAHRHYDPDGLHVLYGETVDRVLSDIRSSTAEDWAVEFELSTPQPLSLEEFYDQMMAEPRDFTWINMHAPEELIERYDTQGDGRINPMFESWAFFDDLYSVDREEWLHSIEHGLEVHPDEYSLEEVWAAVLASPDLSGDLGYRLAMRAPEGLEEYLGVNNFYSTDSLDLLAAHMSGYPDASAWAEAVTSGEGPGDSDYPAGHDEIEPGDPNSNGAYLSPYALASQYITEAEGFTPVWFRDHAPPEVVERYQFDDRPMDAVNAHFDVMRAVYDAYLLGPEEWAARLQDGDPMPLDTWLTREELYDIALQGPDALIAAMDLDGDSEVTEVELGAFRSYVVPLEVRRYYDQEWYSLDSSVEAYAAKLADDAALAAGGEVGLAIDPGTASDDEQPAANAYPLAYAAQSMEHEEFVDHLASLAGQPLYEAVMSRYALAPEGTFYGRYIDEDATAADVAGRMYYDMRILGADGWMARFNAGSGTPMPLDTRYGLDQVYDYASDGPNGVMSMLDVNGDGQVTELEYAAFRQYLAPDVLVTPNIDPWDSAEAYAYAEGLADMVEAAGSYEAWAGIGAPGEDEDSPGDGPMTIAEFAAWDVWLDGLSPLAPGTVVEAIEYLEDRELSPELLARYDASGNGRLNGQEYIVAIVDSAGDDGPYAGQIWQTGHLTPAAFFYFAPHVEEFADGPTYVIGTNKYYWPPEVIEHYNITAPGSVPDALMSQIRTDALQYGNDYEGWVELISQPYDPDSDGTADGSTTLFTINNQDEAETESVGEIPPEPMTMEDFYGNAQTIYNGALAGGYTSQAEYNALYDSLPPELVARYDADGDGTIGLLELEQALNDALAADSYGDWMDPATDSTSTSLRVLNEPEFVLRGSDDDNGFRAKDDDGDGSFAFDDDDDDGPLSPG